MEGHCLKTRGGYARDLQTQGRLHTCSLARMSRGSAEAAAPGQGPLLQPMAAASLPATHTGSRRLQTCPSCLPLGKRIGARSTQSVGTSINLESAITRGERQSVGAGGRCVRKAGCTCVTQVTRADPYTAWLLTAKPTATGPSCLSDGAAQANLGQNSQKWECGKTGAAEGDSWRVCCWLIREEGARGGPNIWSSLGETPQGPRAQQREGNQLVHSLSEYSLGTGEVPTLCVRGRVRESNEVGI